MVNGKNKIKQKIKNVSLIPSLLLSHDYTGSNTYKENSIPILTSGTSMLEELDSLCEEVRRHFLWLRPPVGGGGGPPIWNRWGCSSEILNLTPKGDHLGVAQAFCDP